MEATNHFSAIFFVFFTLFSLGEMMNGALLDLVEQIKKRRRKNW